MSQKHVLIGVTDLTITKYTKDWLKSRSLLHHVQKPLTCPDENLHDDNNSDADISKPKPKLYIYTTANNESELQGLNKNGLILSWWENSQSEIKEKPVSCTLEEHFLQFANSHPNQFLQFKVPKKWSVYPPMVLFNHGTVDLNSSDIDLTELFSTLLEKFFPNCTHIAVNAPIIESDVMRRPFNILPIYGDFGPEPNDTLFENPLEKDLNSAFWCSVVQNGITQIWAPRYTMFSRGNIKEKARVLKNFPIDKDDIVIDMYGGIGYFTFSYVKKGAIVMSWELNPWSVEGMRRGLEANNFKYHIVDTSKNFTSALFSQLKAQGVRVFIFNETNENSLKRFNDLNIKLPISHINMGLLPTSQGCWSNSAEILENYSNKKTAEIHVHENVSIKEFDKFVQRTAQFFHRLSPKFKHLEKVKTFAPDIWHIVVDYILEIS